MEPERLGPYRIVRLLGRGGMGTVYEGVHEETGERAAVKVLSAGLRGDANFCQRFASEIEVLRKLRHPNIVRLHGFGEHEGELFYAMEMVDGKSLEHELRQGRRFGWREVALIGLQTCAALRHAHDRGVIHRDLKPANLLRTEEGWVKLSDFGIARLFGNTGLTTAGNVLGTVEFMAPEQADGRPISPRTDLYALGGVFYALLSGRPPFHGGTLLELLDKKRHSRPEPIARLVSDIPLRLAGIIDQLLDPEPEKRIATAMALARRLQEVLEDQAREPGDRGETTHGAEAEANVSPADNLTVVTQSPVDRELPPTQLLANPPLAAAMDSTAPTLELAEVQSDFVQALSLPETKPTSAFQVFAAAEFGDADRLPASPAQTDSQKSPTSHFVRVQEEDLDRAPALEEPQRVLVAPVTWLLAAALGVTGFVVWYFLQPLTADQLYDRIMAVASEQTIDSYLEVEDEIQQFLMRFPNDSRCEQLQEYRSELELYRLERRFERGARGQISLGKLLPVERAYLDAVNYLRLDPEVGLAKLEALVTLYDRGKGVSGPTQQCVELAQRRLAELRSQLEQARADQWAAIEEQLDLAEQLRAEDPRRARAIWQAVITLYSQAPWADQLVQRARQRLDASPGDTEPAELIGNRTNRTEQQRVEPLP